MLFKVFLLSSIVVGLCSTYSYSDPYNDYSEYTDRYNDRKSSRYNERRGRPKLDKCQSYSIPQTELLEMKKTIDQCHDFLKKNLRSGKKILNVIDGEQRVNENLLEKALKDLGVDNVFLDKKYPLQSFIIQYQTYIHQDIRKMMGGTKEMSPKIFHSPINDEINLNQDEPRPFDCFDILQSGQKKSGVYSIYPRRGLSVKVYCDMDTNGGGWTVFLNRMNQTDRENFYRPWIAYKNGFGNPSTEYWLGLEALHEMTSKKTYTLRIEAEDYEEKKVWGELEEFKVSDERSMYKLYCYSYNPKSTIRSDIFNYHFGMSFSTHDNDNDEWGEINCAENKKGGWWYKDCAWFNPTGVADSPSFKTGIVLFKWSNKDSSSRILKSVQLKMRPTQHKYS